MNQFFIAVCLGLILLSCKTQKKKAEAVNKGLTAHAIASEPFDIFQQNYGRKIVSGVLAHYKVGPVNQQAFLFALEDGATLFLPVGMSLKHDYEPVTGTFFQSGASLKKNMKTYLYEGFMPSETVPLKLALQVERMDSLCQGEIKTVSSLSPGKTNMLRFKNMKVKYFGQYLGQQTDETVNDKKKQ